MSRTLDLAAWRLFVESVKAGSVSAACERLNMEPSTASRVIKALERDLGFELFLRNSRPVRLSSGGHVAYNEALELLAVYDKVMNRLRENHESMAGLIRIATHIGLASLEMPARLVEFQKIYPDVEFDIVELSAPPPRGFVDADGQNVDVIIGYGTGEIEGAQARYSGDMPLIACASPLYIKKNGMPRNPEDCNRHKGIVTSLQYRDPITTVAKHGVVKSVNWKSTLKCHSILVAKGAAMLGAGVALDMPLFHCAKELADGSLVRVFDGWSAPSFECYIYASNYAWENKRVRVFTEWMAEKQRETLQKLHEVSGI